MNKKRREEIRIQEAEVEAIRKDLSTLIARLKVVKGKYQDIREMESDELDQKSERYRDSENGQAILDTLNCLDSLDFGLDEVIDKATEVEVSLRADGSIVQSSDEAKGSED